MTLQATPPTAIKRLYPHVDEVQDWRAQSSLRLLWDRIHDLTEQLQALQATQGQLVTHANTADVAIAAAQRSADAAATTQATAAAQGTVPADSLGAYGVSADASAFAIGPTPVTFPGLGAAQIYSSPDVTTWAETSVLTDVSFGGGQITIAHSKLGAWPPVVIAADGTQQESTLWVFFNLFATWYAAGGERFRPGQTTKALSAPSQIGPGWFYDVSRWGPMANYVPAVGELVGFMVVAGSTRSDNRTSVQERSNILWINFPA